jgi:hypothetical protein
MERKRQADRCADAHIYRETERVRCKETDTERE